MSRYTTRAGLWQAPSDQEYWGAFEDSPARRGITVHSSRGSADTGLLDASGNPLFREPDFAVGFIDTVKR